MKKLLYLLGVTVILCGEMVFAIYSSTVEFDKDMDAKLRLPHTAIGKKDLRRFLPITVNSWRYEIPFLGDNDFESKALEFSKLLSDRQEIISELKRDNRYKIRVALFKLRRSKKQYSPLQTEKRSRVNSSKESIKRISGACFSKGQGAPKGRFQTGLPSPLPPIVVSQAHTLRRPF